MLEKNKTYPLREILREIKDSSYQDITFDIYWKDVDGLEPELNDELFIADEVEATDSDEEILPQIVLKMRWWLTYQGELVRDVVQNALYQKQNVTDCELLKGLRYYSHYDCFMDLVNVESNFPLPVWNPARKRWETQGGDEATL